MWIVCVPAADEEFDQLCFEYGIELDDVVSTGAGPAQHTSTQLANQLHSVE
jgi:hypothetical protein